MADQPGSQPLGLALRGYLALGHAVPLLATPLLRRRLARGREDAARWTEKLGVPGLPRPEGRLIWLHAVGVGEVLALRGLILALADLAPDLSFLITSSARSSALVMAGNLPPRSVHQYLPLDAPGYLARFLDHWRPMLSVWGEQDLWPGAVVATARRGVPLALVNARITAKSHRRRARAAGLYRDVLARFSLIDAQDQASAGHLRALGARVVQVTGSLKAAAPPLAADPGTLARLRTLLQGRKVWVAASTHPGDEAAAIAAARALADHPRWLLILVPRTVARADEVAGALDAAGLRHARRSTGLDPAPTDQVWLADSYGELGLWYRLSGSALIGGGFDRIGGHNPWEALTLGVAVLHGPDTANFRDDYARLHAAGAAAEVSAATLPQWLADAPAIEALQQAGLAMVTQAEGRLRPLARQLLGLAEAGA